MTKAQKSIPIHPQAQYWTLSQIQSVHLSESLLSIAIASFEMNIDNLFFTVLKLVADNLHKKWIGCRLRSWFILFIGSAVERILIDRCLIFDTDIDWQTLFHSDYHDNIKSNGTNFHHRQMYFIAFFIMMNNYCILLDINLWKFFSTSSAAA